MKRILITGINSYIGNSVEKWLLKESNKYEITKISVRNDSWHREDFSKFDVIFHVAGIAHIKETKKNEELYFKINRDLVFSVAKKAKMAEVKQFIFLSSMSVYGLEIGVIDNNTVTDPKSSYGKSKLEGENLLKSLESNNFKIAIVRPPMIYGKNCKGNYNKLKKFAIKSPIFPNINNKRSMLYIDNLCEFIKNLINDNSGGLFFPQNSEYVCTSELVRQIAKEHGKKIYMTKLFNPLLKILRISTIDKVFGNLIYDIKEDLIDYIKFKESVIDCEK